MATEEDLFLKFICENIWNDSKPFFRDFLADFIDVVPEECKNADIDAVCEKLKSCVLEAIESEDAGMRKRITRQNPNTKHGDMEEKEYQEELERLNKEMDEEFEELARGIEKDYTEIINQLI